MANQKALVLPPPTCAPALLNANATEKKLYWDRSHYSKPEAQICALAHSSTVYVGNLAFSTRTIHLRRHFEQVGPVSEVHLGLDRFKKVPCGFAFVEFHHRIDALSAVANLTGTKLDGMPIRAELDAGFKPGREYGRGTSGGQVRDDRGGGNSGRKRRRSDEGGEEQQQHRQQSSSRQFGARWESPSTQDKTAQQQTGQNNSAAGGEYYGPSSDS
mmetsp:Transcript_3999/g.10116  ORF Transcript_3999/g.10116 Transcript_3999/m.10116 type:complete len:215 (-) Transcript_3999:393-1037(-)